jgi:CubicO group peptidase (beta-lactamase class C family)
MRTATILLALLGVLALLPSLADQRDPGRDRGPAGLEARVDAYLAPYVECHDFSGAVLIARGDTVLLRKGYGMASYELGVPNTADTKFQIASITKTFTAAAILLLQDKGRLRLDDHLDRFLPDFPRADKITLVHLLAHRSGVADPDYGALFHKRVTPDELIASFKDRPFLFEPGARSEYSNAGYVLLARVIEKASGRRYGDFLREEFFTPLGMADTGDFDRETVVPKRAAGYQPGPGPSGLQNALAPDPSSELGSGCLWSTADDLFKWARAVRSERLFKWTGLPWPYGWGRRDQYGHRYLEQSGLVPGFMSHLIVFRDEPVTVVCLANVQSGLFGRLEKDLTALAFGGKVDDAPPAPRVVAVSPRRLRGCVGLYQGPGFRFRIVEEDGHFYGKFDDGPGRTFLLPVGDDEWFMRASYARVRVRRDERGRAVGLAITWGGVGEPMKFTRVEPAGTRGG